MKKQLPLPLKIDCTGLSRKHAFELADKLVKHFDLVEMWDDDEIVAHKPRSYYDYGQAWDIIDRYGVKAV